MVRLEMQEEKVKNSTLSIVGGSTYTALGCGGWSGGYSGGSTIERNGASGGGGNQARGGSASVVETSIKFKKQLQKCQQIHTFQMERAVVIIVLEEALNQVKQEQEMVN